MADLVAYGWTTENVGRFAWRAARAHPTSVLSLAERWDVAYYAVVVLLLESETEPTNHAAWNAAVSAISTTADRELREHGYSTKTGKPMHTWAAWWHSPRPARDGLEEKILERIAVWQVLAALPDYQRRAIFALARHGSYAVAADILGISYNSIRVYLRDGRATCRALWNYPDPPGHHWGQDKPTTRTPEWSARGALAQHRSHARNRAA